MPSATPSVARERVRGTRRPRGIVIRFPPRANFVTGQRRRSIVRQPLANGASLVVVRAWLLVCVFAGSARADDLTLRWETEQPPSTLELDPVFQTMLAHFDETEALPNPERTVEAHRIGVDLGDHTHATLSSTI